MFREKALLSKPEAFSSGGSAFAGEVLSLRRSRTVLLYSKRLRRRTTTVPGWGLVHAGAAMPGGLVPAGWAPVGGVPVGLVLVGSAALPPPEPPTLPVQERPLIDIHTTPRARYRAGDLARIRVPPWGSAVTHR